jgi:hypothetical protein
MNESKERRLPHFLCGARPSVLRKAEHQYGPIGSDFQRRWKKIKLANASLVPWQLVERLRFGSPSDLGDRGMQEEHTSPIFIVGHWQAGHSLMHHLLLTDPQFASVNLLHSVLPASFRTLKAPITWFLNRKLPKTRGVDSLPLGMQAPQGDDFMLAGLTDLSLYYGYVFPQSYDKVLKRALLFEDVLEAQISDWMNIYKRALGKVAATQPGKRLVSRNASNTTRIPQILQMYPHARFIHMYRNPWNVFAAQESRLQALTGRWCLQTPDAQQFQESTLNFFVRMMEKFYADCHRIPDGHLIEVRYEDLQAEPVETMQQVYKTLNLGDIDDQGVDRLRHTAAQVGELAGHKQSVPPQLNEIVAKRWSEMIKRWNYVAPVAE